jgi:hypothetical protein
MRMMILMKDTNNCVINMTFLEGLDWIGIGFGDLIMVMVKR